MEKLNYNITINASRERVWQILWGMDTYPQWTSVFSANSSVETDNWKKGSKVIFGDGTGNGMVSMVADNKPNEYMSFKHLGEINDGVEDTTSEKVQLWAGSTENYTLKDADGKTELLVDMDIAAEWKDHFAKIWPQAMDKIKELSEKNLVAS
jgi:uncharacterized protein YndB with AHSA1/START domain